MKNLLFFLILIFLSSCYSVKNDIGNKLYKGTILSDVKLLDADDNDNRKLEIKFYRLDTNLNANIEISENKLIIKKLQILKKTDTVTIAKFVDSQNHGIKDGKFNTTFKYENDKHYKLIHDSNSITTNSIDGDSIKPFLSKSLIKYDSTKYMHGRFKYYKTEKSPQALTIPFKIRFGMENVDYSIATGVNLGVGYSFKRINYRYKPISESEFKNPYKYKQKITKMAITPFLGITTVDLNMKNTEGAVMDDRKVFGFTGGVLFSIGFNNFDLGLAIGLDNVVGGSNSDWIYNYNPWIGFGVGLDIFK